MVIQILLHFNHCLGFYKRKKTQKGILTNAGKHLKLIESL